MKQYLIPCAKVTVIYNTAANIIVPSKPVLSMIQGCIMSQKALAGATVGGKADVCERKI